MLEGTFQNLKEIRYLDLNIRSQLRFEFEKIRSPLNDEKCITVGIMLP